jgi:hypothetical protein
MRRTGWWGVCAIFERFFRLRVFTGHYLPESEEEYNYQFIKAIYPLYLGFVKNIPLNPKQKTLIRKDAAKRIFNLAN